MFNWSVLDQDDVPMLKSYIEDTQTAINNLNKLKEGLSDSVLSDQARKAINTQVSELKNAITLYQGAIDPPLMPSMQLREAIQNVQMDPDKADPRKFLAKIEAVEQFVEAQVKKETQIDVKIDKLSELQGALDNERKKEGVSKEKLTQIDDQINQMQAAKQTLEKAKNPSWLDRMLGVIFPEKEKERKNILENPDNFSIASFEQAAAKLQEVVKSAVSPSRPTDNGRTMSVDDAIKRIDGLIALNQDKLQKLNDFSKLGYLDAHQQSVVKSAMDSLGGLDKFKAEVGKIAYQQASDPHAGQLYDRISKLGEVIGGIRNAGQSVVEKQAAAVEVQAENNTRLRR